MSNLTDYGELLSIIQAIPDNKIKPLYIPINTFNQEGGNLHYWIVEDNTVGYLQHYKNKHNRY